MGKGGEGETCVKLYLACRGAPHLSGGGISKAREKEKKEKDKAQAEEWARDAKEAAAKEDKKKNDSDVDFFGEWVWAVAGIKAISGFGLEKDFGNPKVGDEYSKVHLVKTREL